MVEEKMEKRKIIFVGGGYKCYEVLKPKPSDSRNSMEFWHKHGERKSLKGIHDLFYSGNFSIDTTDAVMYAIGEYKRKSAEKREQHLSGLEDTLNQK